MAYTAYQNWWEEFVPEGYIFMMATTESSLSPSHGDFGLDLALIASEIQADNLECWLGILWQGIAQNRSYGT
jgi:hypothetical protein